jgi:hypothetical protein
MRLIDADGDVEFAYSNWLASYIDDNFKQSTKYFCAQPLPVRDLSDLMELIGGDALE